jgi:hypothetical protein
MADLSHNDWMSFSSASMRVCEQQQVVQHVYYVCRVILLHQPDIKKEVQ